MRRNSFVRKEHLKKDVLIKKVFDKKAHLKGKFVSLYLLKRDAEPDINRVAFIIKRNLYDKKIVTRNRIKRLLREAYRKIKHLLPTGYDLVFLATNVKENTKSTVIERDIIDVFKKRIKK